MNLQPDWSVTKYTLVVVAATDIDVVDVVVARIVELLVVTVELCVVDIEETVVDEGVVVLATVVDVGEVVVLVELIEVETEVTGVVTIRTQLKFFMLSFFFLLHFTLSTVSLSSNPGRQKGW